MVVDDAKAPSVLSTALLLSPCLSVRALSGPNKPAIAEIIGTAFGVNANAAADIELCRRLYDVKAAYGAPVPTPVASACVLIADK